MSQEVDDRAFCAQCGVALSPSGRFCVACGATRGRSEATGDLAPKAASPGLAGASRRRPWLVPSLALAGMLLVGGVLAVLLRPGGSSSPKVSTVLTAANGGHAEPKSNRVSYDASIRSSTTRLAASAAVLGRALTEVARPAQLASVRGIALGRIAAVQSDRVTIGKAHAAPAARSLQRDIVSAVGLHRRYLLMLVRITRLPARAALKRLPAAQRLAQSSLRAYGAYFAAAGRPNLVANTGFADLSGVADALKLKSDAESAAARKADEAARPKTPTPSLPAIYAGNFASVDGRQQCYANDAWATCTSSISGQTVSVRVGGVASYDGGSSAVDAGTRMPEGTSFTTPNGLIACESGSFGIHCVDDTQPATGFYLGDRYARIINNGEERRI